MNKKEVGTHSNFTNAEKEQKVITFLDMIASQKKLMLIFFVPKTVKF